MEDRLKFASKPFAEKARQFAAAVRESGDTSREVRRLVINGERRYFEVVEASVDGSMIGAARDVSDLEEAKHDLDRYVGAYTDVLEKLNTGVAIWGPNRRLTFFNRAFANTFQLDEDWLSTGPSHDELLDHMREKRTIPEQADFRAYKQYFSDMYTALVEPVEELIYLPGGTTLRVGRSPHPLGGLLFFYEDMSDRLELERARNTLIAVQRTTLDNLSQGVAVFGGDGKLRLYNRAYGDLWSLEEAFLDSEPHLGEVLQRMIPQFSEPGESTVNVADLVSRTLERVGHRQRLERLDGTVVDRTTVPLPDGATLVTHLDVTDSIRIERALRERTEAFEEADNLKSQFIANVSYELRTPLNTISGFSEILIDQFFGELNPRQLEYVEGILESSGHLLALINDILDLANLEAGQMLLETETFDIQNMINGVVRLVDDRVFDRRLKIRLEVPPHIGSLLADERRIRQVVYNLLGSAMRQSEPGGTIQLGASRQDGELSIWIKDNGKGFDIAEQSDAFEKFGRPGTHSGEPGTGLGLALVKSFVELHGGRVQLTSAAGAGTRVTCVFPDHNKPATPAA